MDIIKLVSTKLNIEEITDSVSSESCGAISIFVGTTRDNFDGKKVVRLEYEAYESMAINEIQKICVKIRETWNIEHIAIYHRLGVVPVKEASIIIAISSPHRKESLEAVHFTIDAMKASVPIWKKEVYEVSAGENTLANASNEASAWKANPECSWTNKSKNSSINSAGAGV